jgi:hypothetical protein
MQNVIPCTHAVMLFHSMPFRCCGSDVYGVFTQQAWSRGTNLNGGIGVNGLRWGDVEGSEGMWTDENRCDIGRRGVD